MAFITMWKFGVYECMLLLLNERVIVRLIDDTSILREETVTSADAAMRLTQAWALETRAAACAPVAAA